ncbi:hypothetical protein [Escherichia phage vB-Eco-KMB41]|nr:hypothetical protein [Escherichia phage vB-Eco-KMB41]
MAITVNTRFPTYTDALIDSHRVQALLRVNTCAKLAPVSCNVYERENKGEKLGFGYVLRVGPITIHCRGITRYSVDYHDEGSGWTCDAVTAEDAIQEAYEYLAKRLQCLQLGIAILSDAAE